MASVKKDSQKQDEPKAGTGSNLPAVQSTAPTGVATIDPELAALLAGDAETNRQTFATDDLAIPFIRVLQGLSPEVTRGSGDKYNPDARPSMFLNTVTREVFDGEAGIVVIPVCFAPSYIEWKQRGDQGGGIVKDWKQDASNLARCTKNEKGHDITPEGTQMVRSGMYYVSLVDEATGTARQAVLSLSGTQLKKSRRWNSIIKELVVTDPAINNGQPFTPAMFYMSYRLTTVPEKNDKGSWFGVDIKPNGATITLRNGAKLYKDARAFAAAAMAGTVKVQSTEDALGVEVVSNEVVQREPGDEPF